MRRIALSVLIGLAIGVAVGLTVGWGLLPVELRGSPMRDLSSHFKDEYTVMVATGYQVDRDLNAATERLKPLGYSTDREVFLYVRDITERSISGRGTGREADIRSLAVLSCAMGYCTPPMQPFLLPPAATPGQ